MDESTMLLRQNAISTGESEAEQSDWIEVSHLIDYKLENGNFQVNTFTIKGKQRIVSAVKLLVEKNNGGDHI